MERFDIKTYATGRYRIKVKVRDKKIKLSYWIVIVYGAAQEERKMSFWLSLVLLVVIKNYHY